MRLETIKSDELTTVTVGNESIATGQCILVKHDDSEDPKVDVASQWKAKVLEVRALDTEHVYLRVSWLNRPADLDGGKRKYHGTNELIPTNQMDIIDAMAVNGTLPVEFWDEYNDEKNLPAEDQYFWRQTYDVASGTFSVRAGQIEHRKGHHTDFRLGIAQALHRQ